ncbi:MAG: class IV adenylate cyclase [Phycisphaerae bacterium]|nr:class IV adenylate cyclase [Phycisphaerae bacterium]
MGVEIEAKLQVESLTEVEGRLKGGRAEFVAEQHQRDTYYDDPLRALEGGDRCLRIRHQRVGDREEVLLTHKGPKLPDAFKRREETEVSIGDGQAMDQLLTALGFRRALVVSKTRRLWRMGPCLVALDDVAGLGTFVEVEGPGDQAICAVQKALGLESAQHVPTGYASLIASKKAERRTKNSEW